MPAPRCSSSSSPSYSDCPEGTSSGNGATACFDCVAGEYQGTPENSFFNGYPTCISCSAAKFTDASKRASCDSALCAQGKWSVSNKPSTCYSLDCAAGEYASKGHCLSCEKGTFNNQVKRACFDTCPPCSSSSLGAAECTKCVSGNFGRDDFVYPFRMTCYDFPKGKISRTSGATSCSTCSVGMIPSTSES